MARSIFSESNVISTSPFFILVPCSTASATGKVDHSAGWRTISLISRLSNNPSNSIWILNGSRLTVYVGAAGVEDSLAGLSAAGLSAADLSGAALSGVDLSGVGLSAVVVSAACLSALGVPAAGALAAGLSALSEVAGSALVAAVKQLKIRKNKTKVCWRRCMTYH